MKNNQIGIFINQPFVEYLVGICESSTTSDNEKNIVFAESTNLKITVPLKDVKASMIKKFELSEFKSTYKEALNAVNAYNKKEKLSLSHLQILQLTYALTALGDYSDTAVKKEYQKLEMFYNKK